MRQADIRERISEKLYKGLIRPDEVFVSDGAKCDIGRLQMMFGRGVVSAVQVRLRPAKTIIASKILQRHRYLCSSLA